MDSKTQLELILGASYKQCQVDVFDILLSYKEKYPLAAPMIREITEDILHVHNIREASGYAFNAESQGLKI